VRRLNVGLILIAFVLSLFAGRLVQLQGLESKKYAKLAMSESLQTVDIPAVRGDITDAGGNPLAMSVESDLIYADPETIEASDRAHVADSLATTLGLNETTVLAEISQPGSQYVEITRNVPPDQARMISAMNLQGIGMTPQYTRVYPNGALAANLIGFVSPTGPGGALAGGDGLESGLNSILAGRTGEERVEMSMDGQVIPTGVDEVVKRPVQGKGVRLTILRDLEWKAQQAIDAQVKSTHSLSGTVIVMNPHNGQVLAMASAPTYDPAKYGSATEQELGNPAVEDAYEPGSTNKVITASAVLQDGGVTPTTAFNVPDVINRDGTAFHDSEYHATEQLTFAGVLAQSSNVGTIEASEHVSRQTLYDYMRAYGYGQPTGVGLPGENVGSLLPVAKWSGITRYTVAFGQGVSVNALQVASVYATIANDGIRVAPTLVAGYTDSKGNFAPVAPPSSRRVISAYTASEIREMLAGVVSKDGTAPVADIPGYDVAGKTGTAQRVNPKTGSYAGGGYTASFVGFAPGDDPQLVCEVVLQKPQGDYYGGDVAAPVFKDVMQFALQSLKIPPTGTPRPMIKIFAN
jgi:cell division protein FtsI (penicillin-binding protein 3)